MLATVYNTLWHATSARGGSITKHYRVLWITTLVRQYAILQTEEERDAFITQLRINNFGPQSQKRSGLRPPKGTQPPPGPPDGGPGPSSGPRIVASASSKKRK